MTFSEKLSKLKTEIQTNFTNKEKNETTQLFREKKLN